MMRLKKELITAFLQYSQAKGHVLGIFVLIKNEVSFGSAQALKYDDKSIAGKITNVVIIIFGAISFAIGIIALN